MITLKTWILIISLPIFVIYWIADIALLAFYYGLSSDAIPRVIASYHAMEYWNEQIYLAKFYQSFACIGSFISLLLLVSFIRNRHLQYLYRSISMLVTGYSEWIGIALFWSWWTLIGYLYNVIGFNVNGWKLNQSILTRNIFEIPGILGFEVLIALLFVWLGKNDQKSRIMKCLIFVLVNLVSWVVYLELATWHAGNAPKIIPALQPAPAAALTQILISNTFPPNNLMMATVPSITYHRCISKEYIYMNSEINYRNIRNIEALLFYALGERNDGLKVAIFYSMNLIYPMMRGIAAFGVLATPQIMNVFGFSSDATIAALAIGDFFTSLLRHATEPLFYWLLKYCQKRADRFVVNNGYKEHFIQALYQSPVIMEYSIPFLYNFFRQDHLDVSTRVKGI